MDIEEKEEKIVRILENLGYVRSKAKIMLFFIKNENGTSREIERAMILRQPEVSIGTKGLRKEGIIKAKDSPKKEKRKGRPEKIFTRKMSRDELVSFLEKRVLAKISLTKRCLSELNQIIGQVQKVY